MCSAYTLNKTDVFEMFYNCCYKRAHNLFSGMDESYSVACTVRMLGSNR